MAVLCIISALVWHTLKLLVNKLPMGIPTSKWMIKISESWFFNFGWLHLWYFQMKVFLKGISHLDFGLILLYLYNLSISTIIVTLAMLHFKWIIWPRKIEKIKKNSGILEEFWPSDTFFRRLLGVAFQVFFEIKKMEFSWKAEFPENRTTS